MNMDDVFALRESLTNRYYWAQAEDIVFVIGQKEFSALRIGLDCAGWATPDWHKKTLLGSDLIIAMDSCFKAYLK